MDADIVIVGAGSAGSVLANRLPADPSLKVTLIEAGGPGRHPYTRIPAAYARLMEHRSLTWGYRTTPDPASGNRAILYPRGRGLGGSSAINGMIHLRGQPQDYDRWAQKGCIGWSYDELVPYFRRSERYDAAHDPERGRDGAVTVEQVADRGPLLEAFVAAAQAMGLPYLEDYNGRVQDGVAWTRQARGGRWRSSAKTAYLDPAIGRPTLTVITDARCRRVAVEDGRATGVEIERAGRREPIAPAASTTPRAAAIVSPQILQISGIDPGGLLARHGIAVLHDLPAVGRNLQDHSLVRMAWRVRNVGTANERSRGVRLAWEVAKWAFSGRGILTCSPGMILCFPRSREGLESPDIQAVVAPGSWRQGTFGLLEDEPGVSMGVWQHRPESVGEVEIVSSDPAVAPSIRPGYLEAEADRRALLWGIRFCRRWIAQAPLDPYRGAETLPGAEAESDDELLAFARAYGSTTYHPCGTCRMGPDGDAMAVLDPRLRVRGLGGLWVADASAFPDMISANTNATVYALAEKASDLIRDELRRAPSP
jgi:choline dehydrogenase